jgi:hypothetical protein
VESSDGGLNARHHRGLAQMETPGRPETGTGFLNSPAVRGFWMDPSVIGKVKRGAVEMAGGASRGAIYMEGRGWQPGDFPQGEGLFHSFAPLIHRGRQAEA